MESFTKGEQNQMTHGKTNQQRRPIKQLVQGHEHQPKFGNLSNKNSCARCGTQASLVHRRTRDLRSRVSQLQRVFILGIDMNIVQCPDEFFEPSARAAMRRRVAGQQPKVNGRYFSVGDVLNHDDGAYEWGHEDEQEIGNVTTRMQLDEHVSSRRLRSVPSLEVQNVAMDETADGVKPQRETCTLLERCESQNKHSSSTGMQLLARGKNQTLVTELGPHEQWKLHDTVLRMSNRRKRCTYPCSKE